MKRVKKGALVIAALQVCFALLANYAWGMKSWTMQAIPGRGDSTIINLEQANDSDIQKAIAQAEELIQKYPGKDFTASVMFQLLELYYRQASQDYQARMEGYEKQLTLFDQGKISVEPTVPRVSYAKAIQIGYRILDKFPTASFVDKVIYRLAVCHLQEGNQDRAVEFFQKLANEYTYSPYYDEANFRLGEQYFDRRDYEQAIAYYSRLMDKWQSPFFDMALYKLGWSYYNVDNYTKSISTFIFLIDDLSRLEKAKQELLGKTMADLRKDAIAYIAECFAELGGAARLETFLKEIGDKQYSQSIFLRLAEIYQERDAYDESNETYAAILRLWPLYEKAPEVQAKIVENYLHIENQEAAEKARETLVSQYGPGSQWLRKYPEGQAREIALKLAEKNLYILATEAQTRALSNKSKKDFALAISRYQEFIEKFPESGSTAKVQFYQAESYYEMGDYFNAARAYENVVIHYSDSKYAPQAAYNRVVATLNLYQATDGTPADTNTIYVKDFLGSGETRPIRVSNPHFAEFIAACNDFARFFPADQKLPEVLMKLGESLFNRGFYDLAKDAYVMVVNRNADTGFTIQAYSMIAQSAFKQQDFITAEKWYRRVIEEFSDSTQYVRKAETMIASAKFKLAEQLKEEGQIDYAAQAFENIAASTENKDIAERALLESALQYEKSGQKTKAIIIYENLRYRFPKSNKVDESLFKAAVLAEALPDYQRAAQDYLELVKIRPNSIYAARALFNAAIAYENLDDFDRASQTYEKYAQTFRNDPDRYLEALSKVGEYAYKRKDYIKAREMFTRVLKEYSAFVDEGKTIDEYLPAEAQYKLGDLYYQDYLKIKLVEPLAVNLRRKQKLFKQVVLACQNAAKYKVADWTTAALFRIGSAYEEFGKAFINSPRPKGLSENMKAKYEKNLESKVEPLKQKALETYRQNLRLADENNIQNSWIKLSRERAEKLTIELGFSKPNTPAAATKQQLSDKTRFNEK